MTLRLVQETACDYDFEKLCVDDLDIQFGDLRFTRAQLQAMDSQFLRRLAAAVESDEINGKSTRLEIESFFAVQSTLSDYGQE
jgi:hypothetical protein